MDYETTFSNRCHSYSYAVHTYPKVLQQEFQTAVKELNLQKDDILLNIPASCVSLSSFYTVQPKKVYEFETNKEFAELTNTPTCSFFSIPLPDKSVTKIISLASLHHMTLEERPLFYRECKRILKPGGELVIGDVKKGSDPAKWLNIFVNEHNPLGHKGVFWDGNDIPTFQEEGFITQLVERKYTWDFDTKEFMLDFTKHLFGVECDKKTLEQGLEDYLTLKKIDKGYSYPWSLVYIHAKLA